MIHYDRTLARHLWRLCRVHRDANVRGLALEWLVGYLFWTRLAYRPRFRLRHIDGETDILLQRTFDRHPLMEAIGSYLLVECKAVQGPVTSGMVKKFGSNVRFASCRAGILVSLSGVTGAGRLGGVTAAAYTARKLYHRDGLVVLILSEADVDAVVEDRTSLLSVLEDAYEAIRFDLRL